MKTTLTVTLMITLAATAGAQVLVHETQSKADVEQHLQVLLEKAPASGIHLSFETRAIKGAPYAGEAVTESVHVLADGNRIVRRTAVRVYRDSTGRTRRETMGPDGQVTSVTISNPSTGISYVLDPGTNIAHRTTAVTSFVSAGGARAGQSAGGGAVAFSVSDDAKRDAETKVAYGVQLKVAEEAKAGHETQVTTHVTTGQSGATTVTWVDSQAATSGAPPTREDLGQQTIEGVVAKGSRSTIVIPAGAIGNEQPITVVSEEWSSPELKVLVMTKHVDPRVGETTYRLTNISRSEPDASLFELPAGHTVK